MKIDADEKELLESVERGEWKSAGGGKRERTRYLSLRKGDVPERPAAEHPAVEQGPGGDSEAGARGGLAVSDADREPAAQVRGRAPQRDLRSGLRRFAKRKPASRPSSFFLVANPSSRFQTLRGSSELGRVGLWRRGVGASQGEISVPGDVGTERLTLSKRARSTTPTSLRLESTICGRSGTV